MGNKRVKTNLFEVLRGERSIPEIIDHLDEEMRGVVAEDVQSFIRRSLMGVPDDNIAFIRVPKCATTSVHTECLRAYRSIWCFEGQGLQLLHPGACDDAAEVRGISTWQQRKAVLTYFLAHNKTRYVAGHYAVDEDILEAFGDEYSFITTLRDPVERWISHYLYNKHRERSDPRYDIDDDIESFLQTERGRGIGQIALAYFSDTGDLGPDERETDRVQQKARENLRKFDLVGFVEDLGQFEREFGRKFDFEIDLGHRNRNPAPSDEKRVSDEVREKIRETCSAEIRLYEWAREELAA